MSGLLSYLKAAMFSIKFKSLISFPDYLLVLWLPIGITLPKPDKQGWWPHGMTRIEWVKRPVAYLAKYLSKDDADAFPKGCRIMGCGGLSEPARNERCWWLMPTWVKDIASIEDKTSARNRWRDCAEKLR